MATFIVDGFAVGQSLTVIGGDTDHLTIPGQALGTTVVTNAGTYVYAKASATFAAGDLCQLSADGLYSVSATTTTTIGSVANAVVVPQQAISSGQFGYFFSGNGLFNLSVANAVSANTKLTTTGTTKVAGTGGTAIGAQTVGNTTGGAAVISCWAPSALGGTLNS